MNRAGVSLIELVIAVTIVSVGVAGVASLTATAARSLVYARALDESRVLLQSFVDSVAGEQALISGRSTYPGGMLTWDVSASADSAAWASFEHVALPAPIRIEFIVARAGGSGGTNAIP